MLYGDTLSDIAAGARRPLLARLLQRHRRRPRASRSRAARAAPRVSAGITISPDSQGGAVVTQQLVFTTTNWNQAQTVTVEAIDNQFVDGHDALVFPPMTGTHRPDPRPGDHRRRRQRQPGAVPAQPAHAPGRDEPAARRRHDRVPAGARPRRHEPGRHGVLHRPERDERQRDDRPAARLRPAHERLRVHRRVPERRRRPGVRSTSAGISQRHPLDRQHDAVHARADRAGDVPVHRHAGPVDGAGHAADLDADLRRPDRPVDARATCTLSGSANVGDIWNADAQRPASFSYTTKSRRQTSPTIASQAARRSRSAPASRSTIAGEQAHGISNGCGVQRSASTSSRLPARSSTAPRASPARRR